MGILVGGLQRDTKTWGKSGSLFFSRLPTSLKPRAYLGRLGHDTFKDQDVSLKVTAKALLFATYVDSTIISEPLGNNVQVIYIGNDIEKALRMPAQMSMAMIFSNKINNCVPWS